MIEYWPIVVVFVFAILLYVGTILWTEVIFKPKLVQKDEEIDDYARQFETLATEMLSAAHRLYGKQLDLFTKEKERRQKAELSSTGR